MTAVLEATGVRKVYRSGDLSLVEVLNHVDLSVQRGSGPVGAKWGSTARRTPLSHQSDWTPCATG
jgi:hypothetical protein